MNCSCFRKDKMKLKACSIHVRARVRMSYCTTELYLSVDKLKKKQTTGKTAAGQRRCQCTDVNVYVMYNLSHVETERTYTPAQLQTLIKSCQLSSSVVPVRTTIQPYPESGNPNFFASARVRNPSRCFVKRSAVLFFVSTRLTDL